MRNEVRAMANIVANVGPSMDMTHLRYIIILTTDTKLNVFCDTYRHIVKIRKNIF